jgi:hypothetical protein
MSADFSAKLGASSAELNAKLNEVMGVVEKVSLHLVFIVGSYIVLTQLFVKDVITTLHRGCSGGGSSATRGYATHVSGRTWRHLSLEEGLQPKLLFSIDKAKHTR